MAWDLGPNVNQPETLVHVQCHMWEDANISPIIVFNPNASPDASERIDSFKRKEEQAPIVGATKKH